MTNNPSIEEMKNNHHDFNDKQGLTDKPKNQSLEERICIAGSYSAEKIALIKQLLKDTWVAAQSNAGEVAANIKKVKGTAPIYVSTPYNPTKIKAN
jgi:hypothetical protein